MSADNYILCRKHRDGWLVTHEAASNDEPSNADERYERVMSPEGAYCSGFFHTLETARQFVDFLYETNYIEYGPVFTHRREDTHDMSNDNSDALVAFRCAGGEDEDVWAVAEGDPYAVIEAAIAAGEVSDYRPDEVVVISSATVTIDEVPQRADILVAYDGTKWTTQFHFEDGTERETNEAPEGDLAELMERLVKS